MLKNFIKQSPTKNVLAPTQALAPILIKQRIADAPVSVDAVLPYNYLFGRDWNIVEQSKSGGQIISRYPLFISELSKNRSTGLHYVTLTWKVDERWHDMQVERCMIARNLNIIALSNYNIPVTS